MARDIIFDRARIARQYLPNAIIHTNTNGDYLNVQTLEKSYDAGFDSLDVQIYLTDEQSQDYDKAILARDKYIRALNKRIENKVVFDVVKDQPDWYELKGVYKGRLKVSVRWRDFSINGTNRGGIAVTDRVCRTSPCRSPFHTFHIDFNGNVMPCCNLRSDIREHASCSIGNVYESTVFDIFASKKATDFRCSLIGFNEKRSPCDDCTFQLIDDTDINRQYEVNLLRKGGMI